MIYHAAFAQFWIQNSIMILLFNYCIKKEMRDIFITSYETHTSEVQM